MSIERRTIAYQGISRRQAAKLAGHPLPSRPAGVPPTSGYGRAVLAYQKVLAKQGIKQTPGQIRQSSQMKELWRKIRPTTKGELTKGAKYFKERAKERSEYVTLFFAHDEDEFWKLYHGV